VAALIKSQEVLIMGVSEFKVISSKVMYEKGDLVEWIWLVEGG
jgi:hypothetical protein